MDVTGQFTSNYLRKHTAFLKQTNKHNVQKMDGNNFFYEIQATFLIDLICPSGILQGTPNCAWFKWSHFKFLWLRWQGRASKQTNLLLLAGIQSPLIKSLHSPFSLYWTGEHSPVLHFDVFIIVIASWVAVHYWWGHTVKTNQTICMLNKCPPVHNAPRV